MRNAYYVGSQGLSAVHPEASGLWEKLAKRDRGDANALIDPDGCRNYIVGPKERLAQRLEREQSGDAALVQDRISE